MFRKLNVQSNSIPPLPTPLNFPTFMLKFKPITIFLFLYLQERKKENGVSKFTKIPKEKCYPEETLNQGILFQEHGPALYEGTYKD